MQNVLVTRCHETLLCLLACEGKAIPLEIKVDVCNLLQALQAELLKPDSEVDINLVIGAISQIGDILDRLGFTDDLIEIIRQMFGG